MRLQIHASVNVYNAIDAANFAGLSQTGAPVTVRGSIMRPIAAPANAPSIKTPVVVSGRLPSQSRVNMDRTPPSM
jgi:hypothetical protein